MGRRIQYRPRLWILTDNRKTAALWPGNGRGWSYPKYFFDTLEREFPDVGTVFQPFAGFDDYGNTMDIDIRKKPEICGDALEIPIKDNSFDSIVADPPYDDFHRGVMIRALHEFKRVARRYVFILHWYRMPTIRGLERMGFRIIYIPRNYIRPVLLNIYKISKEVVQ